MAGFNSASIVDVSTGSISVSTSNPAMLLRCCCDQKTKKMCAFFNSKRCQNEHQIDWNIGIHFDSDPQIRIENKKQRWVYLKNGSYSQTDDQPCDSARSLPFERSHEARIGPAPGTIGLDERIGHLDMTPHGKTVRKK